MGLVAGRRETGQVTALLVGTALAVASLCYVLYPLFRADIAVAPRPIVKARYTEQALAVMRAGDAPVCERCGPRPERDAEFCSTCGAALLS